MHVISYRRLREYSEKHAEYDKEQWKNDTYF